MKLGVSAFAWTASFSNSHLHLLPQVREFGFSALEIPMFNPSALPVAALRRGFEANDLDCTVCAILPADINPISADPIIRRRALAHLFECVETSAELGAHLLGGPLFAPIGYLPGHRPTVDEWKWAVEIFQSLGDLLEKNTMTLSIEPVNRSETFFLRTAAEAKEFCAAVAHLRFGVTIDTFHANIEEKSIPAAITSLGSSLKHLHVSENDRGVLGTGHINFVEILDALYQIEYDGYLIIEGFGFSSNEPDAPGALWADGNVSPEDVASQGISYLRDLLAKKRC
jgi:D-psicose/D-tagatose/L-ribulose 3-epimerase